MSENNVIFQVEKNSGERLVFRATEYKGHRLLDLRTDFRDKDGEYHMTKKGVSLPAAMWRRILPEIEAALLGVEGVTV